MSDIQITITVEKITKILETQLDEVLKSTYSNPVRDLVVSAIKGQEGAIKQVIDEIIVNAISNPEFKTKMSDLVIQRLVESALKK